jgi:intracellular sulfur oxidation DsrE/DsrF family protein
MMTAVLGVIGLASGRGALAQGEKKHRVVLDLTAESPERWDGALRNAENVRKAFGAENVEVQLVVHGKAYPLLQQTNAEMEARLRGLHAGGVRLSLCQNTMKRFNVTRESLFPFVDTVDAAMAELVRKQEAGWAYVKVGS